MFKNGLCSALRLTDSLQDNDPSDPRQIAERLKSAALFIQNYKLSVAVGLEVLYAALSGSTDLLQNDGRYQSGETTPVLREQFQSEQTYDEDPYAPVS